MVPNRATHHIKIFLKGKNMKRHPIDTNAPLYFNACQHSATNSTTQPESVCLKSTTETPEICSKLTIKTRKRRQWRRLDIFLVNFGQISHIVLVFPLLNLNKCRLGKGMRELKRENASPKWVKRNLASVLEISYFDFEQIYKLPTTRLKPILQKPIDWIVLQIN